MAVLDATNRLRVLAQLMRELPASLQPWPSVTKPDLAAAVAAVDDWIETNQTTINLVFPQPARTQLSPGQKTFLFCFVAMRRAGWLRAQED